MPNMLKTAVKVKRSACDQCRAKRVRCLRAENSMAPCARCNHIGARCVTGAPGHPGRPPKQRTNDGHPMAANTTRVSSPGGMGPRHRTSTSLRDLDLVETYAPAMVGEPPSAAGPPARAPRYEADIRTSSWDCWLNGATASELVGSKLAQTNSLGAILAHDGSQPGFWGASEDSAALFGCSPSVEQSPAAPGESVPALDCEIDEMLDMDLGPLLDPRQSAVLPQPQGPPPQCISPASSLMRFREEIDQRIAAVDEYYSDPFKVVQGCKEDGAGAEQAENPAALLLTCSTKFINIIQSLTPAVTGQTCAQSEESLSTEVVLLALSSYLALMRLFDSVFHTIYEFICDLPPASFKSVKVKSVLRVGGISTLQDVPLKTYATGILDAIQGQVRTLERCMGIPPEYCLADEAATSTAPGIFSRSDRTRLFWAVMEQEDVKPRRGGKSYVESIRVNIKDSMRFLDE
jgi:hypothetical protein